MMLTRRTRDERGATAVVLRIREAGNQHAPRQRISAMRADRATGNFLEVINRLHVARLGGILVNVINEDFAALQAGKPKLAAIIRESAVMRLMAAFERMTVNDLAVIRRTWLHVERDKFVRTVAETFDA